jgi:hypothetical protein
MREFPTEAERIPNLFVDRTPSLQWENFQPEPDQFVKLQHVSFQTVVSEFPYLLCRKSRISKSEIKKKTVNHKWICKISHLQNISYLKSLFTKCPIFGILINCKVGKATLD